MTNPKKLTAGMGKAKKIAIGIGIGFVALIVLSGVANYTSNDSLEQENTAPAPKESPKPIPLGDKKNPATVDDTVMSGDISFKVTNVKTASSVGNSFAGENADGVFIILDLVMENKGNESVQIISDYFRLIDSQERKFESDNQAWIYLDDNVFLKQLQPTIPTKGQIVFDVPTTSESYILEVTDSIFGFEKKYIKIGMFP